MRVVRDLACVYKSMCWGKRKAWIMGSEAGGLGLGFRVQGSICFSNLYSESAKYFWVPIILFSPEP